MCKISVLVPIYNVEKYLKECLDSLKCQTLLDIEFICINDGSSDSSLEIIKDYMENDNRFKLIDKENSGYGASMNKGLDYACGEYIGILESDDFADKNMFEDLYNLAKKFNADIVKSNYYNYLTSNKQSRKTGMWTKYKTDQIITVKQYPRLLKTLPSIWSGIFKKEFLKENNIRFLETSGASYQDTSFAFKTLSAAKSIVLTNNAYVHYRNDNENSSVNSKGKVFLICGEYEEITNFQNKNPEIKKYTNTQKLLNEYAAYMWNLKRINKDFRNDFIDKIAQIFKSYYDANEISKDFYKKYSKREIELLINDKSQYTNYITHKIDTQQNRSARRKFFSIRINSSRISIVLFGKQVIEIG